MRSLRRRVEVSLQRRPRRGRESVAGFVNERRITEQRRRADRYFGRRDENGVAKLASETVFTEPRRVWRLVSLGVSRRKAFGNEVAFVEPVATG